MRLFLIIDETNFYQPNFVAELIQKTKHEVVAAILVTKVLPKSNIEQYMMKNFFFLNICELIKLGTRKLYFQFKNYFQKYREGKNFYSVKKVYQYFNIDYFEVEYDINKDAYLNKIKAKNPDIIISSNSMIFGDDILNIPKYCINRHSGLLPSYGGIWPVFQALRRNEREVGVSVHIMGKELDKGILLSQTVIPIETEDTLDTLYQKCFQKSAETVINAIEKIEKNEIESIPSNREMSYFSFPKKEHWKQFRKRRIKFI